MRAHTNPFFSQRTPPTSAVEFVFSKYISVFFQSHTHIICLYWLPFPSNHLSLFRKTLLCPTPPPFWLPQSLLGRCASSLYLASAPFFSGSCTTSVLVPFWVDSTLWVIVSAKVRVECTCWFLVNSFDQFYLNQKCVFILTNRRAKRSWILFEKINTEWN